MAKVALDVIGGVSVIMALGFGLGAYVQGLEDLPGGWFVMATVVYMVGSVWLVIKVLGSRRPSE